MKTSDPPWLWRQSPGQCTPSPVREPGGFQTLQCSQSYQIVVSICQDSRHHGYSVWYGCDGALSAFQWTQTMWDLKLHRCHQLRLPNVAPLTLKTSQVSSLSLIARREDLGSHSITARSHLRSFHQEVLVYQIMLKPLFSTTNQVNKTVSGKIR